MRKSRVINAILAMLLALILQSCDDDQGPVKLPQPTDCIMTLHVSRGDCPWLDMTDGYEQEQANKHVKAVAFDGAADLALPSLAEFDKPDILMIRDAAQKKVSVNSRYFSDLERGDATRMGMGQVHSLGKFIDLSFTRLKPRDLVMFMIKSQIIETYQHLEAELRFLRDEDLPDAYKAYFYGVHTYYTNERHDKKFAFVVTIDKKTGEMILTGGDILDVRGPKGK